VAAHQCQGSVGGDPVAGAQVADQLRRISRFGWRGSLPGAGQLVAAGTYRPAQGVQRAQRQTLSTGRNVQGMMPGVSGAIAGLGGVATCSSKFALGPGAAVP